MRLTDLLPLPLLLSSVACGPALSSPARADAPLLVDATGAPVLALPAGKDAWIVSIRSSHHDCAPDAPSCDERFEASSDGAWLAHAEPNPRTPGAPARTSRRTLRSDELSALRALVTSAELDHEMSAGFVCQGGQKSHDSSTWIELQRRSGRRGQQADVCFRGPSQLENGPTKLWAMLADTRAAEKVK